MSNVEELEKRFLAELARSPESFQQAHAVLAELRVSGANGQLLALLEVSLDWREHQRYAAGISRILHEILEQDVIDPLIHARSFVVAAVLYMRQRTEETDSLMLTIENHAAEFFEEWDMPQVRTWKVGYYHNMAVTYWRIGMLDEAQMILEDVVLQARECMAFQCWLSKVYTLLALVAIDELEFDQAHSYLALAEQQDQGCDLAWRLLAKGRLLQEQLNDEAEPTEQAEEAAKYFCAAYETAKKVKDYFLMGDALTYLAYLHSDTGNLEAFWYTYQMCKQLSEDFGVQFNYHIHDLAATLPPLPTGGRDQNAEDVYASGGCTHYQYCSL